MNGLAEKLLTLINLAPAWSDALRNKLQAKAAELDRLAQELKAAHAPGANGKLAGPEPRVNLTDTGNALRFAKQHVDDARYCAPWKAWLIWSGSHWEEDSRHAIDQLAKQTVRTMFAEALASTDRAGALIQQHASGEQQNAAIVSAQDSAKTLTAHALKSESAPRIAAMLRLAQGELAVTPDQLDRDPFLFNCLNGTLDLRTGKFRPHERGDHITKVAPVTFDPKAQCPRWQRALRSIFPEQPLTEDAAGDAETIDFVQRFFGMCLTGDVSEQVLAIFHGDGSNGKSLVLDTVCSILGPYAGPTPEGLLLVRRGEQHPTEIADLFGRRLVHSTETGEGARLDEPRVKRLTGDKKLKARRCHENFWEFDVTHKLLICTNHRPRIRGTDHAVWRRVLLVPFTATFWDPAKPKPGEVQLERFRRDKSLVQSHFQDEWSGILNWMLAGCLRWQTHGLSPPRSIQSAVDEYQKSEDLVAQFAEERCQVIDSQAVRTKSGILYAAFCKWLEDLGERTRISHRAFTARIVQLTGFQVERSDARYLPGIHLLDSNEGEKDRGAQSNYDLEI